MHALPKLGVWPSDATKLPDTRRNCVARTVYDVGEWLGGRNTIEFAERAAKYSSITVLAGVFVQLQHDIAQGNEAFFSRGSEPQDDPPNGFDVLVGHVTLIARPLGAAVGTIIATRYVVPWVVGGVALATRLVACGLVEVDKGLQISTAARKLLRVHGGLPQPPVGETRRGCGRPTTPGGLSRPNQEKKARQRSAGRPQPPCAMPFRAAVPPRAAQPSPPCAAQDVMASVALVLPTVPAPLFAAASMSQPASEPAAPGLPAQPEPRAAAPMSAADAVVPPKQSARARRSDKAAECAAAPAKPRGPVITGLSYDNRVVVEQAHELYWHARDRYSAQRLHSIRPAPHKTVARAHRHTPSPELRLAFQRVLCARQADGLRAQDIVDVLGRYGYHTYLVGGVVRDLLRHASLAVGHADVDLVTDAPTSEVQRLIAMGLEPELPDLKITSSHVAHYQGVISYQNIDVASIRVRGMFEPKRFNHATCVQVYPLSFGTYLPADAENRDLTCNAVYYDPMRNLLLDPTTHGMTDARVGVLRAPSAELAMKNTTWALRYLKFILRGYVPADAVATQLMIANARKFFPTPRFLQALERIHEGDFDAWCQGIADVLAQTGCDDLAEQVHRAMATAAR